MESLLPYYERELSYLRRLSHDFSRRYPKVANRLSLSGETCDDPHVERLIESFAFLTSRIHKKLDDDFPEITDSLLSVIYPQYLRPFPSTSIAHFDAGSASAQLTKSAHIPRGTMLHTQPVRGISCRFRTTYDVDILPVRIVRASHETIIDSAGLRNELIKSTSSVIRLDLACQSESVGFGGIGMERLRLFLNGDASVVSLIREAIFSKAVGLWVSTPFSSEKIELPLTAIRPVGFSAEDTLLDQDVRTHHAYQLLLEYFAFPEKFNFIDIDFDGLYTRLPLQVRELEIRIGIKGDVAQNNPASGLLDRISKDNFVLGCTPVVNLFSQMPEPIRVTETSSSYPIIVDSRRSQAFDIYSIDRVFKVQKTTDGEEVNEFRPFYSVRHGAQQEDPARYWHVNYAEGESSNDCLMEISLVDETLNPQRPETSTLSLGLTCTNRDLPSQLPFGLVEGDLFIEGGSIAKTVRFLRKPTPTFRFMRGRGAQWRLISSLSLNHLSLTSEGVDVIKEMLALYDITRSPSNSKQIHGIVSIENRPVTARMKGNPYPTFVRGLEIRIGLDEAHYAGIGLFMFAQVLDHFFGLYVHTNSFTQLVIVSSQSGQELVRCQPRSGESILA
ncbi:type VI secretion system baseplate subunit TssF [Noviherbaspirillum cavernae]|uniref:Type VI secretion system baseplate subunit TssF n=1 Tax=Noviherbaspirillum cavernae TaxID=2320862 RepID=A0A418X0W8_9BURK|nr:type VI secretion system baseplate subunit TssF [Noviherbaspirillum cavernae]RJG06136.1 type VI secretion system baseplate subunit TssF [Noviherbaspirillum cavernae]